MTSKDKLYGAIARDDTKAAREAVVRDPSVVALPFLGATWLHLAAQMGRIGIMEVLVDAGLAVDQPTQEGTGTPLESAAGQGHYQACEWLLDHGADINHCLGVSATPIFSAVFSKSFNVVKLFVERGADLGATFGDPPRDVITYAQVYGTPEIVAYLARQVST
jgi:hypothetical protein